MAHVLHFAGIVPLMWVTLGVHVCKLCMHGANRSTVGQKSRAHWKPKEISIAFCWNERLTNCAVTK